MLVKKKFKTKKYLCEKAVRQKVDSTLCVSYKFLISFLKSFGGQQGRGQNEVVGSQLGSEYDRSRRNRSLDRSTELEQFNSTFRGSSRGLAGQSGGIGYSGSTTHLNLQLGPLQLPPRGYGHSYQLADCELHCQDNNEDFKWKDVQVFLVISVGSIPEKSENPPL